MGMLAKIRRMYFRDKLPLREIARQTGLSRNTLRHWLRQNEMREPAYPVRTSPSLLDPYKEQLVNWLRTDSHRPKRDRRTAKVLFQLIQAQGYPGGYARVALFVKRWREAGGAAPARSGLHPAAVRAGRGLPVRLELRVRGDRRTAPATGSGAYQAGRTAVSSWWWPIPCKATRCCLTPMPVAFAAFGGVPRRGIYDNMKTAVDKVGRGKERTVNARFQAMCGHYLFEPDFCNRAAGWEKGIVEKNVQDRRRQIWHACNGTGPHSPNSMTGWHVSAGRPGWICAIRTGLT